MQEKSLMGPRLYAVLLLIVGLMLGYFSYPFADFNNESSIFYKFNSKLQNIEFRLGLDLAGGTHLIYEADVSEVAQSDVREAMTILRDVIERRVNLFGVSEPVVQVSRTGSSERLIVELAGVFDINEAIKLIGETPYLEFREVQQVLIPETEINVGAIESEDIINNDVVESVDDGTVTESDEDFDSIGTDEIAPEQGFQFVPTELTGKYLDRAELIFDELNRPAINIFFNNEGADLFQQITKRNIGNQLAIFLDGSPISIPTVQQEISGGNAQITGVFEREEALTLVRRLNSGALPVRISLISQQSVEAALGQESLQRTFRAGVVGLFMVILFMVAWYRIPGLISVLALFVYVVILLAIFKLVPVTLSAAAITGFILSIGMAVDANVLIFERLKEELLAGKSLEGSMTEGFERAWTSIRDSNISSIITAIILYWFGTSIIRGFALTLGIGVAVSMFSAIFVTRTFLRSIFRGEVKKYRSLLLSGLHK